MGKSEKVIILGASDNPERYSYKAFKMLQEYGHQVFPVHPALKNIEGKEVSKNLIEATQKVGGKVDTLTIYVNPQIQEAQKEDVLSIKPRRVIFNPGTENPSFEKALQEAGIKVVIGCTLVLLRTNQYENL